MMVLTHEVGHCLGIHEHTSDGGLMDPGSAASNTITTPVKNMLGLLYSLPPGTDIGRKLTSGYAKARTQKKLKWSKKTNRTWGAKTGHRLSIKKLPAQLKKRAAPRILRRVIIYD